MFCHKKQSAGAAMVKLVGGMLAAIGVVAIIGFIVSNSRCMKRKMRAIATTCSDAVEDVVESTKDMFDSNK
jgi:hypothetical protein